MATIDDVARRAGVSTATVSRALRGLPNVAESTREHVRRVAAELNFAVSRSASSLASGRTDTVAIVVPHVTRWFFAKVISGAEAVLRAAGYDVLLYSIGDAESRERFFASLPLRGRADAVLVLALPITATEVGLLEGLGVPVGLVGHDVAGLLSVGIDDAAGARAATQHLVNLGHERIALISGDDDPLGFTVPGKRRDAFREVLRANGLRAAGEAVGDFTFAGGERAMTELLTRKDPPTAVFAMSDEMAVGALKALRRHAIEPGSGVSVIGFDDHEMAEVLDLTTVAQPVAEQGSTAASLLLRQVGGQRAAEPDRVVLPVRLVVRGTTAPPT
ncbi:LacI family DNA-binding transcriptional regulator [Allokutzneria albata]|uniref:DNA-binding transcriptional regulator, LacI/PurR family n=1 Tax=Allokutzneria albata TaxID=211114 RepID=A0A1G9RA62_ALLAB|nr:LacI family DNA-binding transcriptional regulator [Allokutzneria albata]SDM20133.1 DNA-binding transcriptional regulator, LacI/PurR family [Allokutzneria albata]